ncbi:MAG TPA: cytochrome c biogenesis protein ResB [Candidatus Limnocylindria bacterium]|nr:cytochrome c biogenesis protein ResB [Candidatus Limnocylindria bacterium]
MTGAEPIENKTEQMPSPNRGVSRWPRPLLHVMDFFSSLRLTVVFLGLSVLLVFIGTLAQVDEGLYEAQNRYFRSLFIYWGPHGASWKIPVFPGGYLIGGVLLVNLLAAHARRFKFSRKKIGIFIIHAGIVLMLVGQFATDLLSRETQMQMFEGESKSYSEDSRETEFVLIDTSDAKADRTYSIPESKLARHPEIKDSRLPFVVRVKSYWPNASIFEEPPIKANIPPGSLKPAPTDGTLSQHFVLPEPVVKDMDRRNVPAAVVELVGDKGPVASFLVYAGVFTRQSFMANGKSYDVALRFARYYNPFKVTLLKATHENYKGTDLPKNFASVVRLENPKQNEARETKIYMNNPLRYEGLTFFQYQMAADEMAVQRMGRASSTLQVVRNPSWLTPYLSCVLVGVGLTVQFMSHLIGFLMKRRNA